MISLSPLQFLSKLWPARLMTNETLELRYIDREAGTIRREFLSSIPKFLEAAKEHSDCDLYFGIATRYGSISGKKKDCYRVQTVWADLDGKNIEDCLFTPKPDILVESGGGVHAYWTLDSPVLVKDERWSDIEAVNRWLVKKFHADIGAIDISRILRVPGTFNYKYDPPRKVKAYAL